MQPGSLYRHNTRVLLLPEVEPASWSAAARDAFPAAGWQIREASAAAPGVRRFVDRLGMVLTFVGLSALLIGGLGVANAVRHYLAGKAETIATLKCLGAPGGLIVEVYLLQVLILTAGGVLAGLVLGAGLPLAGLALLEGVLPIPVALGLRPAPLLVAAAHGLLHRADLRLLALGAGARGARGRPVPRRHRRPATAAPAWPTLAPRPRARWRWRRWRLPPPAPPASPPGSCWARC